MPGKLRRSKLQSPEPHVACEVDGSDRGVQSPLGTENEGVLMLVKQCHKPPTHYIYMYNIHNIKIFHKYNITYYNIIKYNII
jgi:hypothetical protein